MEDEQIIALYLQRDETAIDRTKERYGARLRSLAYGILGNYEDAEESENDTYLKAWDSIPPQHPQYFYAFLAKICRNLALHRLDWRGAEKRSATVVELSWELELCIPDAAAERSFEAQEIGALLSAFLKGEPKQSRVIFLRRYALAESVQEIARALGVSESKVKSALFRTRNRLRRYLEQEGITR